MIKSKEEYVKMLIELAEKGELYKTLYSGKIDVAAIEMFDKDLDILDLLLEFEDYNASFGVTFRGS